MPKQTSESDTGFVIFIVIIILIAIGVYSANPYLLIGPLVVGGVHALTKKFFIRGSDDQPQQATPRSQSPAHTVNVTQPPLAQQARTGWFYHANGSEFCPLDEATLRQLKNVGVINFATYIRRADGGNWIAFSDVFGSN